MAAKRKTGFDRYFEQRMGEPSFAANYREARAEIDAADTLIRALEAARARTGMTKADLARRIETSPEVIRRLLTASDGNPTMSTVLKVASVLGYHLELVANRPKASRGRRSAPRVEAARRSRS